MIPVGVLTSPGVWVGLATAVSAILTASGHGPAGAVLVDPGWQAAVNHVITGVGAVLAGFLPAPGHKG